MIEKYDELANKSGACIVNCCALDSVPWDIVTLRAANELQRVSKQKLVKIDFFDRINGEFSGGTFATLMNSLTNAAPKSELGFDPLLKEIGAKSKSGVSFKANL